MPRSRASFRPFSLPVIALRIGGTIVKALVDTGATESLVDPRLVKQLGLREEERRWIVGIGTEPRQVSSVSITGAAVGRCSLTRFSAGIMDLTNLRIGIHLILGVNAFRGYRLQFDFDKGTLHLLSDQ
ncbi:MAG TPA: retropepsin-like aspartic protease [Candidatus Binatia bacterium]|nr:retropepsin-like aspartic protease [Candidatus Binatia bacterium]